jgi:hypothetical protein
MPGTSTGMFNTSQLIFNQSCISLSSTTLSRDSSKARAGCGGLWITVVVLIANVAGDVLKSAIRHDLRSPIGVSAGLLGYLWHNRRVFA